MIFLLVTGVLGLLTSEIADYLISLREIKQTVEIIPFNLDAPKISWEWNKEKTSLIKTSGLSLEYFVANETTFTKYYWEVWNNIESSPNLIKEFINKYSWLSSNYNIFLLLSSNYNLDSPNILDFSTRTCPLHTLEYHLIDENIIIKAHPQSNIQISSIHHILSTK